jgi:hypothetical protein
MGIWDRVFAQLGGGRAGPRTPDEAIISPGT